MAKTHKPLERRIRPCDVFPKTVKRAGLNEMDEASIARTFNRLAQLCHSKVLSGGEKLDCLLLLTTCRNEWYTLNAMYAEAKQWCKEGDKYTGFGDAMNALNRAISGSLKLEDAGVKAAKTLEISAHYLDEFVRKHKLFFERFEKVHSDLLRFADTITDTHARNEFKRYYTGLDSGPGPDHSLSPKVVPDYEIYQRRLTDWYSVARPLTGLARTFISEVLEIGQPHEKTCADYLSELTESLQIWKKPYGYVCPDRLPTEILSWRWSTLQRAEAPNVTHYLQQFISYCSDICQIARMFLHEMLPSKQEQKGQFLLRKPGEQALIPVQGKMFELIGGMFVFIMDMRNSSGEPYRTPELKVKISNIINLLCDDGETVSEFTYNDCRAIGCQSIQKGIQSLTRLWHALEAERSPSGFAGLRMGAICGNMLVGWRGEWREDHILLDCTNTLVTASRIMDLDKLRWKSSNDAQALVRNLGDWSTDESLIFFDTSVYEALSEDTRTKCRKAGVLGLRSVGGKLCWAIPIPLLAKALE